LTGRGFEEVSRRKAGKWHLANLGTRGLGANCSCGVDGLKKYIAVESDRTPWMPVEESNKIAKTEDRWSEAPEERKTIE